MVVSLCASGRVAPARNFIRVVDRPRVAPWDRRVWPIRRRESASAVPGILRRGHLGCELVPKYRLAATLRRDDDRYYVTVKGQSALVTFDEVPAPAGVERHYAVRAKGYYQRWSDDHGKDQTALADRILTEPLYGSRLLMSSWKSLKAR